MKSIEATAKTIDEAIARGLRQLGVDRDSVSVEVLENPKSGFLGFGGNPARIRITLEEQEDLFVSIAPPPAVSSTAVGEQPQPVVTPVQQADTTEAPVNTEAQAASITELPTQEDATVSESSRRTARRDSSQEDRIAFAKEFVETLLDKMHTPATASPYFDEAGNLRIDLSGDHMGLVIGRRGETLDALQHITAFAVNRGESHRVKVLMDTEHYRARREESLQGLARKTAAKVIKYRRNMALEPMNAYERHVIHEALQDWDGVTTASTGTEPNRRVVVQYTPHH